MACDRGKNTEARNEEVKFNFVITKYSIEMSTMKEQNFTIRFP